MTDILIMTALIVISWLFGMITGRKLEQIKFRKFLDSTTKVIRQMNEEFAQELIDKQSFWDDKHAMAEDPN